MGIKIKDKNPDHSKIFTLALQGAEQLLRKRTQTTMGVRFPAQSPESSDKRYEYKLYDGAAGIGLVLLDLACATEDKRYTDLCNEIWHGLIESTPEHGPLPVGLFNGFSGVALFHLARAQLLQDQDAFQQAIDLGKRLAQSPLIDTDLLRGAAGAGLLQVALYYATRDTIFLEGARRAAAFLAETAITTDSGVTWTVRDPRQPLSTEDESYAEMAVDRHPGLAHGTAGICLFLVELARIEQDAFVIKLYEDGFRWLETKAIRTPNGVVWPRSDAHPVIQNHWCHGSAGIAHAYLALYRHTGDRQALAVAEAAGQSTWEAYVARPDEPSCHCHGFSGAIDLFLELTSHAETEIWQQRAHSIVHRLEPYVANANPHTACALGSEDPGLGLGTAGVVRQLLCLAGYPVYPILIAKRNLLSIKPSAQVPSMTGRKPWSDTHSKLIDSKLSHLIPRVAVRFKNVERYLELGVPDSDLTCVIVDELRNRPAGAAYFRAVAKISQTYNRIRALYPQLLTENALGATTLGPLLREIAALALRSDTDSQRVIRTARRMAANAVDALEMLFARLESDREGVLSGIVEGKLTGVEVRRSDPHRRGQRVVVLRFENGLPLLYKSRAVAIDRELAGSSVDGEQATLADQCRKWLTPSIRGGLLPTHRIIVADEWYGYVEQIAGGELAAVIPPLDAFDSDAAQMLPLPVVARIKKGDEKRFWYSAGLLAGHAFTLGIRDLHAENVICGSSQSTPDLTIHAVDLEMAFGSVVDLEDTQLLDGPRWGAPSNADTHSHSALHPSLSFACGLHAEEWVIELTTAGPRLAPYPWRACRWIFPHLAQNPDGSFGYGNELCAFLRGFADQWKMLQTRSREVSEHLRAKLSGVPGRLVFKPTVSYIASLMQRKMGGSPIPGAAAHQKVNIAFPLIPAEMRQLDQLDIPYFFRFLGEEESPKNIFWMERPGVRYVRARHLPPLKLEPFWSVVERQKDPQRLARAVVDAVWAVAPRGTFDYHEPQLGVRVVRTQEDERLLIILLLGEGQNQRLTCRVASEGKIEWWMD